MGRSPGFGSTPTDYLALLRLAFAAAPCLLHLTLPARCNSPVRSTKSTPSHIYCALTVCKHTVSGAVSLPSRGAFHLSLTVLVHYRSHRVFSLGRWSSRIPTGFPVSRGTWDTLAHFQLFVYRGFTFCARPFQATSTKSTRISDESPATPPLHAEVV
jgi:hypothetical protein